MTQQAHTIDRLRTDLLKLAIKPGSVLMVHASLSSLGHVDGAAATVVQALLDVLDEDGTLVMPAFRDSLSIPAPRCNIPAAMTDKARQLTPPYDPATTPTTMGAIAETFRKMHGVLRSPHPTSSITAYGPLAQRLTSSHPLAWATGIQSPYEILHQENAQFLLLGVGFNRLTMLHYAETSIAQGRRKTRLVPEGTQIIAVPDVGDDLDTHFPAIGKLAMARGIAHGGFVGNAKSTLVSAQPLVKLACEYLSAALQDLE